MTRSTHYLALGLLFLLSAPRTFAEVEIRSPGSRPSKVAEDGSIVEPWGAVSLKISQPEEANVAGHRASQEPMPIAVTVAKAGAVTLTQSAYRAPIWPSGVDVLEGVLANSAAEPVRAELELAVPEGMQIGESIGSIQGKPSIVLPSNLKPIREERDWGYTDGVSALPGWARPAVACDLAFKNISAGMGGVPISYRFRVEPGAKRTVVLGFCESHHPTARLRPLLVRVEGVEDRSVDPIAAWGRHIPGVMRFDAVDADADGRLELTVAPHPQARDRNPILNVIWVLKPGARIDEAKLMAGEVNDQAERYVDVGGENDQSLYKPGNLRFAVEIPASDQREFFFLLRSPDCRYLPDMSLGLWNRESLRKAAADVWKDRWEEPAVAEAAK